MTAEEIEAIVRPLTTAVGTPDASAAWQSMRGINVSARVCRWYAVSAGVDGVHKFNPSLIEVMRNALEEIMTSVPLEHSTPATKAYLAECILRAAARGQTNHEELVAAAADELQTALSMST